MEMTAAVFRCAYGSWGRPESEYGRSRHGDRGHGRGARRRRAFTLTTLCRLRPLERAGSLKSYQEKKLKNLIYGLSGVFGNAATRIEVFTASSGVYAYGAYPDIDGLFREQAAELDPKKREAILHRIQQLIHDKAMYLPLWQLAILNGYGPRVAESALGLIADYPWAAPYEELKLKAK